MSLHQDMFEDHNVAKTDIREDGEPDIVRTNNEGMVFVVSHDHCIDEAILLGTYVAWSEVRTTERRL